MTTDKTSTPEATPPSPASSSTEEATLDRPVPSADLQPGGLLDQILEKSRLTASGNAATLRQELTADVKKIREATAHPKDHSFPYKDIRPEDVPRWLVNSEYQQYRTDPVLRFCLGQRWHVEDLDCDLRSVALKKYQEQADDYDNILGDLVPADLRQEGHAIAAETRFDDGTNGTAADDWPVYRRRLQHRRGQPLLGLTTGLPSLDRAIRGLRGLTFLGGGTGVGKSTLALFIAAHALQKHPNLGVLYYSLDMPKTVLYDRLLCQEAGVEYADLMGDPKAPNLRERLVQADGRLSSEILPRLRIAEHLHPGQGQTLLQLMTNDLNRFLQSAAVSEVLVIVDYFQLIPGPDGDDAGLDADFYRVQILQRVQEWSRTNSDPAGFPILAISEVRKGESGRTEISVSDLMGSARVGYSAECVLLLEQAKEVADGPVVPVSLKVAKGRDGAVRTQIDLLFEHTRSRFREAPRPRSRMQDGKSKKDAPAPKSDQAKIDPFAGLEE